jgi:hypothetical protein
VKPCVPPYASGAIRHDRETQTGPRRSRDCAFVPTGLSQMTCAEEAYSFCALCQGPQLKRVAHEYKNDWLWDAARNGG